MNWIELDSDEKLNNAIAESHDKPVLLFKHSTRCAASFMAKRVVESEWTEQFEDIQPYHLDLLRFRPISNEIADRFDVRHESPQAILLVNGEVVHHSSHNAIQPLKFLAYV